MSPQSIREKLMRTVLYYYLIMVAAAVSLAAAPLRTIFEVKYISAEAIYLDGGAYDSLTVGDRLSITGKDNSTTEIEVNYVAQHSVSCTVIGQPGNISVGSQARLIMKAQSSEAIKDTVKVDTTKMVSHADSSSNAPAPKKSYIRPPTSKMTGNVSFMLYNWNDQSAANFDFRQSTVRLDLKARRLWGKGFTFSLRSRGRYEQRQKSYVSPVTGNAWEYQAWEFSLAYDEPSAPMNFVVGRVLPRRVSSVGYLDGFLVERAFTSHLRAGLFGGAEPDWLFSGRQMSLIKNGGYLSCTYGENNKVYFEQSIAGVGAYHGMDVSREFISLQGRFSVAGRWGISNMADIDFYRSWRKLKTGQTFSLTNLYLNGYYRFGSALRASISYDNMRSVWTLENKSVVDSIFDDHLRQGGHAQLDITLPLGISISSSYGYNKRAGDPQATRSYSLYMNKYGLLGRGMSANITAGGIYRASRERS